MDRVVKLNFDNFLNNDFSLNEFEFNLNDTKFDCSVLIKELELVNDKTVCFTGNRPANLPWKYNEDCELCKLLKIQLKNVLETLIKIGFTKFISGMAMGFDIIASEVLLQLKDEKNYDVCLECALPCLDQTKGWGSDYKKRHQHILNKADKVTFVNNKNYFIGCYEIRNQYMVDNSSLVVACLFKKSAGTMSTLNYARKNNKKIIILK